MSKRSEDDGVQPPGKTSEAYKKFLGDSEEWLSLRSGDKLFAQGDPWKLNAMPGAFFSSFDSYILGFHEMAKEFVGAVLDGHILMRDYFAYPLVATYRHAVELSLKLIILRAEQLLNRETSFPTHHRLGDLWRKARPLMEEACPDDPSVSENDILAEYIETIEKMPFDFGRYPYDRSGNRVHPPEEFTVINFKTLRDGMGRLLNQLGAWSDYLGEMLNIKRQIERDCGDY